LRTNGIVRQGLWALDRLTCIRDYAAVPAAHLVAEDPEARCPAAADRSFPNDTPLRAVGVGDRSHLDHDAPLGSAHLKRRVVDVTDGSTREPRRHRFVDAAVQTDRTAARAQREPEEVDA
jgi:hypothetical protein